MSEGWQDIATAPKNKLVLVGTTDRQGNLGYPVVMSRLVKFPEKLVDGKLWGWLHTGAEWTHWMPLPPPPSGE